jgi:hypothetical protein
MLLSTGKKVGLIWSFANVFFGLLASFGNRKKKYSRFAGE